MTDARKDNRVAIRLIALVAFMLGASFAAVPFYNWFCAVTGFGGVPTTADAGSAVVLDRTVQVRFDASLERHMPWSFKPVANTMEIRLGETGLAFYEAHNPTDRPVAGQASYNVAPYSMGEYFSKIECFCFTEQVLQPGETVQMPVSFYVDPEMLDNRETQDVLEVTLSYTFYEIDLPEDEKIAQASDSLVQQPGVTTN